MKPSSEYRYGYMSRTNPFKDGHYRSGGAFFTRKVRKTHQLGSGKVHIQGDKHHAYIGSFHVSPSVEGDAYQVPWWFTHPDVMNNQRAQLFDRGAEAWKKLRPDLPDFSLATALWELRDVPGMFRNASKGFVDIVNGHRQANGRKGSELSKAGQYYLAAEFGWMSFLRDVTGFIHTQNSGQKRLEQLIRDAGRPVRRSVNLKNSDSDSDGDMRTTYAEVPNWDSLLKPSFLTYAYADKPAGVIQRVGSFNTRIWAEGQMRYFLPPGPRTVQWKRNLMRKIQGGMITPRELYAAMPWSWLADYFTGLGDFIDATAGGVADNLICDYAYIMEHKTWTNTTTVAQSFFTGPNGTNPRRVSASVTNESSFKCRWPASPFGWGLKQTDLSPKQVAILGALGLSRLP
jgi:hypothetical protein